MKHKKYFLWFLIVLAGASAYFYLRNNSLPAAIVNWNLITQKDVNDYYDLGLSYYSKALFAYGSDPKILNDASIQKEIKRAAIEKLIENKLIYTEAQKRAGKDLETIADQKIENVLKNTDISEAVNTMLGSSVESYTAKELRPEAYKEILQGRMDMSQENFDKWLENAKTNAKVYILLPGYSWDGKSVKISSN